MEVDSERRKAKLSASTQDLQNSATASRFFSQKGKRKREEDDDPDIQFVMTRSISQKRSPVLRAHTDENVHVPEAIDPVIQEVGYRSPTGSSVVAVSSPPGPSPLPALQVIKSDDQAPIMISSDASYVSSPETQRTPCPSRPSSASFGRKPGMSEVKVDLPASSLDESSDVDPMDSANTTLDDSLPETPTDSLPILVLKSGEGSSGSRNAEQVAVAGDDEDMDPFDNTAQTVMKGWRDRWSHASPNLPSSAISTVGGSLSIENEVDSPYSRSV